MTIAELLGMAVVFLVIIVIVISRARRTPHTSGLDKEPPVEGRTETVSPGIDDAVVAAISAAVKAHRQGLRR
ncbi:MAG: OadG family protein [Spirochaetaceae bacterium]|jgi:Na+-transporting methylmalonyl-CoA/oxaloacetate decarboxylase gamma subunit|nr:OadG family protein [Spirochaetaceae bacterium]